MEVEDITKYLIDNLEITISKTIEFGPIEQVEVKLLIGDTVISSDSYTIDDY